MRLKAPSSRLMRARYCSTPSSGIGRPRPTATSAISQKAAARMKLASGPAIAIQNSTLAHLGSSVISATPPKMKRVMTFIGRPERRGHHDLGRTWTTNKETTHRIHETTITQNVAGSTDNHDQERRKEQGTG